jgi:glycine/D-amino acid oxidase-like deaminating enzyme
LAPAVDTDGMVVGIYISPDGVCFSFRDGLGYTKAAQLEVKVLPFHEVTDLEVEGQKIARVVTSQGSFAADLVINAAAAWAPGIGRMVGVELPNHAEKHEAIVTESLHAFLGPNLIPMNSGMYVAQTMRGEIYACVGLVMGRRPITKRPSPSS